MISIIVRTKNEERWISLCLKAIFNQVHKDFEVILVDNKSTDKTLSKAREFKVRIINIDEYFPGKALNMGIAVAKGEFICCLSGHCLPIGDHWLSNLVRNFEDKNIAGVYGRQEPMSFTSDFDKRDLLNMFGLDKKIQLRDSFFHNANSMVRKSLLDKIPFDEKVTNIEDRVWAREVLRRGYKIVYEPEASVYHHHGINQDNNPERCSNVVRILEKLQQKSLCRLDIKHMNIVAIVPVKGRADYISGRPLLDYTLQRCRESKYIKRTIVSTDNMKLAALAKKAKAEVPFLRSKELSAEYVDLDKVLQFSLEQIEKTNIFPDLLVILEITYPFREKGLLDAMIEQLVDKGVDSIIPVLPEYKSCWISKDSDIRRIDDGFMPRSLKDPIYVGLVGLGCVTHPVFIREGKRLGDKIGFVEIANPYSPIEVRDRNSLCLAENLLVEWLENN